jgi:hypothetical protein
MADLHFSPRTLFTSSLQSKNDTKALDDSRINLMMAPKKRWYGQRCISDDHFREMWKKCRASLSTKCKNHCSSSNHDKN